MIVVVTADDIDAGIAGTCTLCPLAHALNRALGGMWFVNAERAHQLLDVRRPVELPAAARASGSPRSSSRSTRNRSRPDVHPNPEGDDRELDRL
jgi:hypothetical protein